MNRLWTTYHLHERGEFTLPKRGFWAALLRRFGIRLTRDVVAYASAVVWATPGAKPRIYLQSDGQRVHLMRGVDHKPPVVAEVFWLRAHLYVKDAK
jgi:hypothetical protein